MKPHPASCSVARHPETARGYTRLHIIIFIFLEVALIVVVTVAAAVVFVFAIVVTGALVPFTPAAQLGRRGRRDGLLFARGAAGVIPSPRAEDADDEDDGGCGARQT